MLVLLDPPGLLGLLAFLVRLVPLDFSISLTVGFFGSLISLVSLVSLHSLDSFTSRPLGLLGLLGLLSTLVSWSP